MFVIMLSYDESLRWNECVVIICSPRTLLRLRLVAIFSLVRDKKKALQTGTVIIGALYIDYAGVYKVLIFLKAT